MVTIIVFSTCVGDGAKDQVITITHENGQQYAGSPTCAKCHQEIYKTHLATAHYRTSAPASDETIKGSFDPGKNIFDYNPQMRVVMEKRDDKYFQAAYLQGNADMAQPFDMVIGSGTKGQSYLFWYNNMLFQLPVSYYTPADSWTNSPGYPDNHVLFNRPITGRCLECHGTYFKKISSQDTFPVEYDRNQIVYGIDCERCHGPAKMHVDFQQANPNVKTAKYIINPASLSRKQQLDACALCHSGLRKSIKPSFSFITGDNLENYSEPDYDSSKTAELDVHGNQYGLLTASKCFKMSKDMNCSTCHDTHVKERGNHALFSSRCQNCHSMEKNNFCTVKGDISYIKNNCIKCHMPETPSKILTLRIMEDKDVVPNMVRTHLIGIYKDVK